MNALSPQFADSPQSRLGKMTTVDAVFLPDRHMVPRIRSFVDFATDAFADANWLTDTT